MFGQVLVEHWPHHPSHNKGSCFRRNLPFRGGPLAVRHCKLRPARTCSHPSGLVHSALAGSAPAAGLAASFRLNSPSPERLAGTLPATPPAFVATPGALPTTPQMSLLAAGGSFVADNFDGEPWSDGPPIWYTALDSKAQSLIRNVLTEVEANPCPKHMLSNINKHGEFSSGKLAA
jgi:hypothetical protein